MYSMNMSRAVQFGELRFGGGNRPVRGVQFSLCHRSLRALLCVAGEILRGPERELEFRRVHHAATGIVTGDADQS